MPQREWEENELAGLRATVTRLTRELEAARHDVDCIKEDLAGVTRDRESLRRDLATAREELEREKRLAYFKGAEDELKRHFAEGGCKNAIAAATERAERATELLATALTFLESAPDEVDAAIVRDYGMISDDTRSLCKTGRAFLSPGGAPTAEQVNGGPLAADSKLFPGQRVVVSEPSPRVPTPPAGAPVVGEPKPPGMDKAAEWERMSRSATHSVPPARKERS